MKSTGMMKLNLGGASVACVTLAGLAVSGLALPALGQTWTNSGGNAGRNGQTSERGPDAPETIWTTAPTSVIAWQPVIEGRRVFVVRQTGFPPEPASDRSPIICFDLDTGAELWRFNIPFVTGQWTTWIAGVKDGRVYASRSGNGGSVAAVMYCLDASNGSVLWTSDDTTTAGFYDGVVFAPNGDPIVADFRNITRIDHATGDTVWRVSRLCSVSGNCGGALGADAVYIADAVAGGHRIKRFDLATGVLSYQSGVMAGFTLQNSPMVGPDGTVYLSRTQNNVATDFFYAFEDTGSALVQKWSVPAQWTTSAECAVGPDGSVYFVAPGLLVTRLDPDTGAIIDQAEAPILNDGSNTTPRMAVDRDGRMFLTNGAFTNGRLYSYDADLSLRWSVPFPAVNIGGPSMGPDGTLVVAGTSTNMRAYRTEVPPCAADVNGDGVADVLDFLDFLNAFSACDGQPAPCGDAGVSADFNDDGIVDVLDLLDFLDAFSAGC
ncbi:outer membrane protein assembly factor BamB family protein [Nodularia spumigena]|uniref:outer membrane protein assembly factor BamB family protein n=1 Tax=Nodularia spumigena TaxID=70799 RepID=UPI002B20FD1D|nr:PQQ-binding-like beta-propeller repeat protein [Nodularia spumigena]MEA5557698.1 PQQ-binding-like beta-propeller repeat protein [Nodularia spumigena CH309]